MLGNYFQEVEMAYKHILVEEREHYGLITINRPPANALNTEIIGEFSEAMDQLLAQKALRSIIFTGSGEKIFCAGADLSSGFSGDIGELADNFHKTFLKIERSPKPVIAAINGHALGGGCELSLACHFRIMKKGARIGLTETNLGIIPGAGGTQRLPRVIGYARALELMIFGKQLEAQEALQIGLVHQVVEDVLSAAVALAEKIKERAPIATECVIQSVMRGMGRPLPEALEVEKEQFVRVIKTSDAIEGIQAFFQKRKPEFKGE